MISDIVIIGAGITGSTIARELSKYKLKILVVEKRSDVAFGQPTKGNTGLIHAGYDDEPGTNRAKLCVRGNRLWHDLAPMIGVPFEETGSFVVALSDDEVDHLRELRDRGQKNGVTRLEIIEDREILREMEPNLTTEAVAALFAPTAAITPPYEAAIAMAENAIQNGVQFITETEVEEIVKKNDEVLGVDTNRGRIEARCIINAAGLHADKVSDMADLGHFKIIPRKGEYYLFDKKLFHLVRHILFPVPTPISKGIVVTRTNEGNILIGPNAYEIDDKGDMTTTQDGLEEVFSGALKLVPELSHHRNQIITYFSSLRPETPKRDFIIRTYDELKGFINVAGIRSPGLTAAPAVAEKVIGLVRECGLEFSRKGSFNPIREPMRHPIRESAFSEAERLIQENPKYGHVICRCEHVTEGEIVEAIKRGATTIDGVKFRTRAGMGRCQGGFCTPHIINILSRELGISPTEVTKRGGGSHLLLCETKGLLKEEER